MEGIEFKNIYEEVKVRLKLFFVPSYGIGCTTLPCVLLRILQVGVNSDLPTVQYSAIEGR
jgi:hypothetical protein